MEQPPSFFMQQLDCPQAVAGAEPLWLWAEKVDNCCSSFAMWHLGHSAFCSPKTIASNLCPHSRQRYSKIGIIAPQQPFPSTGGHSPAIMVGVGLYWQHYKCSNTNPLDPATVRCARR